MKTLSSSKVFLISIGMVVGGLMFSVLNVMADITPSTQGIPPVIPYQGVLELNGQPVNRMGDRAMWIEFQIYTSPSAGDIVYRQRLQVEIYQGRFTALIGPSGEGGGRLIDVIQSSAELYLGMVLLGDNLEAADDDIAMSNRQRLMSTPYAMWASGASQFTVQRDLTVGGNVTVGETLTVGGNITTNNDLQANQISASAANLNSLEVTGNANIGGINTNSLTINGQDVNQMIRTWVRSNCRVELGWRDSCGSCVNAPSRVVSSYGNGSCGPFSGGEALCRSGWAGLGTDGNVNNDDVFYIRLVCE